MEYYEKYIEELKICLKEGHDYGEWEKVVSTELNYFGNINYGNKYIGSTEYQRKCKRCGTIEHSKYISKNLSLTLGGKNEK